MQAGAGAAAAEAEARSAAAAVAAAAAAAAASAVAGEYYAEQAAVKYSSSRPCMQSSFPALSTLCASPTQGDHASYR